MVFDYKLHVFHNSKSTTFFQAIMHTSDRGLENTGTSIHSVEAPASISTHMSNHGSDVHSVEAPASISIHTSNHDLEIAETRLVHPVKVSTLISPVPNPEAETLDIEHAPVKDDPRKWSPLRKVSYLISISTRLGYCMNPIFFSL